MSTSALTLTARVLLGVQVLAVTGLGLLVQRESWSMHGWGHELERLAPLDISTAELVGSYSGTDSWLRLEDSGEYRYQGGFWSTGYCEIASVHSAGTWRRDYTGIELQSTDGAGESFHLAVWRTERTLCLTPRPGSGFVDGVLGRYVEQHRESPPARIPPGVNPR